MLLCHNHDFKLSIIIWNSLVCRPRAPLRANDAFLKNHVSELLRETAEWNG